MEQGVGEILLQVRHWNICPGCKMDPQSFASFRDLTALSSYMFLLSCRRCSRLAQTPGCPKHGSFYQSLMSAPRCLRRPMLFCTTSCTSGRLQRESHTACSDNTTGPELKARVKKVLNSYSPQSRAPPPAGRCCRWGGRRTWRPAPPGWRTAGRWCCTAASSGSPSPGRWFDSWTAIR